ncbi:hypothetical protein BD413DRAFT_606075 [Trametes elegans]|nr:hypothetical protein BD413DRAFT_606075 [Trametes elegans]
MPGHHHHVRFADIPSTPSSTFSDATLHSSPGPATPPIMSPSPLPAKHLQLASSAPSPSPLFAPSPLPAGKVAVHPVFAHAPGYGAPLSWHLVQPVESARVQTPQAMRPITVQLAAEPATTPKLASITIVCERLPWSITVTPVGDAPWAAPYVTVGDVLHTIYRTLRRGVTPFELGMQPDPAFHQRVNAAYAARWARVADPLAREQEKLKAIKRVDFLLDACMFKGLSVVPGGAPAQGLGPGVVWKLHVSRP